MNTQALEGFLLPQKLADISSAQTINLLKKVLPKKSKVGYPGTLDTFATGLLVVGIGRTATRILPAYCWSR